jgi:hypothetical protein
MGMLGAGGAAIFCREMPTPSMAACTQYVNKVNDMWHVVHRCDKLAMAPTSCVGLAAKPCSVWQLLLHDSQKAPLGSLSLVPHCSYPRPSIG